MGGSWDIQIVQLTGDGLRAFEAAAAAGSGTLDWQQNERNITFTQTVHGTASTQVGDHNSMTVHVSGIQTEAVLTQLDDLRAFLNLLPEADQEEASAIIERAETAARKGAWDRLQTYGPTLLALSTGAVEFAEKVKTLFGL